jgi:hypothetical protein
MEGSLVDGYGGDVQIDEDIDIVREVVNRD